MAKGGIDFGNVPLGDHDADWFRVMSAASNSSLRVKAASVIGYFVRRRKDEYREIIQYTANKHGLSFDDCFNKLKNGEDLGEPLDYFQVDTAMEAKINANSGDIS